MKHEKVLRALLLKVVNESDGDQDSQPFSGTLSGLIPRKLLPRKIKREDVPSLTLTDDERDRYYSTYNDLRADRETEYLSDQQLKDKLWELVCETYLNRKLYKDNQKLKTKMQDFLSELGRPVQEHEVLFKVNNFDAGAESIELWNGSIKKYSVKELWTWGLKTSRLYRRTLDEFKNQTLIAIKELGNNSSLIIERARKEAEFRLKALQVYLSKQEFLHDDQLLFELSSESAIKNLETPKIVRWRWDRGRRPIKFEHHPNFNEYLKEANRQYNLIQKFNPKIKEAVKRAVYWMGKSIVEPETDLKVIALCTAMETLLTTKADKRKGEAIAYRMVLLEAMQEGVIRHPKQTLWIYELRSSVIHGSSLEETSKTEYHTMRRDAQKTLKNFIDLVNEKKIQKQAEFFRTLETSEHAKTLLTWLWGFRDEHSIQIRDALQEAIGEGKPKPIEVLSSIKKILANSNVETSERINQVQTLLSSLE